MIEINLLPHRERKKQDNIRQQVFAYLIVLACIAAGLFLYNQKLTRKIDALTQEIAIKEKQIEQVKIVAKQVDELEKAKTTLEQKLTIVKKLKDGRTDAYIMLNAMIDLVSDKTLKSKDGREKQLWFTKFEAIEEKVRKTEATKKGETKGKASPKGKKTEKEKKPELPEEAERPPIIITIEGIALDEKSVAAFMTRLQNSKLFSDIKLITLKQEIFKQGKDKPDISLKSFQVACKKTPPPMPIQEAAQPDVKTETKTEIKTEVKEQS